MLWTKLSICTEVLGLILRNQCLYFKVLKNVKHFSKGELTMNGLDPGECVYTAEDKVLQAIATNLR